MTEDKLTTLFCFVDDFCLLYENIYKKQALESGKPFRGFPCGLSLSEIMTVIIGFHNSGFRTFKQYYLYLRMYYKKAFPKLVSYNRFIELMPTAFIPLCSLEVYVGKKEVGSSSMNLIFVSYVIDIFQDLCPASNYSKLFYF